jgi:hypothetical protein
MLGGFVVVSVAVIALLELLSQKSSKAENGGGLIFAADVNSIPSSKTFMYSLLPRIQSELISWRSYLYFPTMLSVCYSMMWRQVCFHFQFYHYKAVLTATSWVDLDVKRLEPWFQMSNPGGAAARDSLLLQYPFDFLPFIPVTALRRKYIQLYLGFNLC